MARRLVLSGSLILVAVVAVTWAEGSGTNGPAPTTSATSRSVQSSGLRASKAGTGSTMRAGKRAIAGPLTWRLVSSYTARRIENDYLPATAKGTYLIAKVVARNGSTRAVTVKGGDVRLDLGGNVYRLAASGVTALELAGRNVLPGTELGPAGTATGWVVFDVPADAVASAAQVCLARPAVSGC